MENIGRQSVYYEKARQRIKKSYFDEDDEEETKHPETVNNAEPDPLDAFMQSIDSQVSAASATPHTLPSSAIPPQRLYQEDTNYNEIKRPVTSNLCTVGDEEEEMDDRELNHKRVIESLPAADHSLKTYQEFRKFFYNPHSDVSLMTEAAVKTWRSQHDITVVGKDTSTFKPVLSFAHVGFNDLLIKTLVHHGLSSPTAIQSQAFPIALSGRDMIGYYYFVTQFFLR